MLMVPCWRVANPSAAMRERGALDLGFPASRLSQYLEGVGVLTFFPEKRSFPALENQERAGTRNFYYDSKPRLLTTSSRRHPSTPLTIIHIYVYLYK